MKRKKSAVMCIILFLAPVLQAQEIFDVIRKGDIEKVKMLVENDPTLVRARNARQSTPLHVAVDLEQEAIVRYLIEKGADVNALNNNESTPLFYAKGTEIAKLLVESGADINKGMPIAWALVAKRKEVAEYLLEKGAGLPDTRTSQGLLFLVRSLRCGSVMFLDKYLKLGFDPLYESNTKNNLLHYAAESNSADLIERLIGLGIAAEKANMFGWTPLHIAAANGNLNVVQALLSKNVANKVRTNDGRTAYNLAVETGNEKIVSYLKSIGIDQSPARFPELKGEYMGQPKPSKMAVPFAPGILNPMHEYHGAITITPDGNEMYWSAYLDDSGATILKSRRVRGQWEKPEIFSRGDVPFISPDGRKFYFLASKQVQGIVKEVICFRDRSESGWSKAKELPEIINSTPGIHWEVSVDRQGNLYFGASGEKGSRIYYSHLKEGEYSKPKILEGLQNMEAFSPFIAPDGSYMLLTNPEEGENLYLIFKKRDGSWTKGIELSNYIGIKGGFCPIVTCDGRFLFFISSVDGKYAHFWVEASFIEELRPTK
jgi:ankyrin repeat protein